MHQSLFFKAFPPPKYMSMRFSGLEISDDAIRCLQYAPSSRGQVISKYDQVLLPDDTILGGDIKNETVFVDILKKFDDKNDLNYVSVSIPEEKAYLFQTDVVGESEKDIAQNIESKLEENVPLLAKDAVFYFDLMPLEVTEGILRASVSVVPRTYVEKQISLLQSAGVFPVAFEVAPKSIARAALNCDPKKTSMVVHVMKSKIGIYIVSAGVVCFTSTVGHGDGISLAQNINHSLTYWSSRPGGHIDEILLAGSRSIEFEEQIVSSLTDTNKCQVNVVNTWKNALNLDSYTPSIPKADSLDYVVVAGLALDL